MLRLLYIRSSVRLSHVHCVKTAEQIVKTVVRANITRRFLVETYL